MADVSRSITANGVWRTAQESAENSCPAWAYHEFIYKSADPVVAGLALAAIRDLISHYKRAGEAEYAVGFGVSQSAMVLRALLYEGFNADESGKRVFDGIFAHVAGGRRSTFGRFAQPSRTLARSGTHLCLRPTSFLSRTSSKRTQTRTGETGC
jgi:hypothetical protein